jgi:hypothetical protein
LSSLRVRSASKAEKEGERERERERKGGIGSAKGWKEEGPNIQ